MPIYTVPPWVDVPDPNNPPAGAVPLDAGHMQAIGQAVLDAVLDIDNAPLWSLGFIRQDPVTGNWPGGWDAAGTPDYLTGSTTVFVRPTARNVLFLWIGWIDPTINTTGTGTSGFRQGWDIFIRTATGS